MIQKRRALLAALIAGGSAVPAGAGCFDWLFHKHAAPVQPYVVGFAPAATITPLGSPVPIGAPTISMQAPMVQASDMTPMGAPALGQGGYVSGYSGISPATAAQMPAYAMVPQPFNNPSVLTGLPVTVGAPSVPVTAFRRSMNPTAVANFGGTSWPQTSYNAAAAFQTQAPTAAMGHPMLVQPQGPVSSGGGWLGRLFGNSYQTDYNNVPTTVYRPVQQLDPATGQMVIVQQPCTTTTQQVQRTPYASMQHAQPAGAPYYGEPTCGNEPSGYLPPQQFVPQPSSLQPVQPQPQFAPPPTYAPQASSQQGGYAPIGSGISQTTATSPSYGSPQNYASPIPSTTAPLQGYPGGYGDAIQPRDAMPLEQPRLESARPSLSPPATSSPVWSSPSWQEPWPGNSSAAHRSPEPANGLNSPQFRRETSTHPSAIPSSSGGSQYSNLPPIPAADDYRPPAWTNAPGSETEPMRSYAAPGGSQPQPPSPPSLNDRTVSQPPHGSFDRNEQSARYASTQREPQAHPIKPIAQAPRDDSGWFAIGQ